MLSAIERGDFDLRDLLAKLSQGFGREPSQRMRLLAIFAADGNLDIDLVELRLRSFLDLTSDLYFNDRIDAVDSARCELARSEIETHRDGPRSLKTTCRMKDADCDQIENFERKRASYDSSAAALVGSTARSGDRQMGELVQEVAGTPRLRRGKTVTGVTATFRLQRTHVPTRRSSLRIRFLKCSDRRSALQLKSSLPPMGYDGRPRRR